MDGFLNLLKPPGMTSHDMVGLARRVLGVKKIGHAGTLDPGAAGVLPVAVGRATRLIEYLSPVGKSYRAEVAFGMATDSGDDTGKAIEKMDSFEMPGEDALRLAMQQMTGILRQVPPAFSAIKVHGQKACDLARKNVAVDLPEREVHIRSFRLLARRERSLLVDVDCSKGTYIRSLCADLGKKLGIPATMSFLVRMRVGSFHLADAHTVEEFRGMGEAALLAPELCLAHLPRYDLPGTRIRPFCNGLPTEDRHLAARREESGLWRVFSKGIFLGIGRLDESGSLSSEKLYVTQEAGMAL